MTVRIVRVRHQETNDAGDQQMVTLLGPRGEALKNVHRLQPFGFHSSPPVGSHGMVAQFGGADGGRLLNFALGLEDKSSRPTNRDVGSTALYDANGNMVSLVQSEVRIVGSSKVVIVSSGTTLTVSSSGVTISGGEVTHDGKNIGSTHRHTGVMSGGATSGPPA